MPTILSKPGENPKVRLSKEEVDDARAWAAEHGLKPEYALKNAARVAFGALPQWPTIDDYIDHPGKRPT